MAIVTGCILFQKGTGISLDQMFYWSNWAKVILKLYMSEKKKGKINQLHCVASCFCQSDMFLNLVVKEQSFEALWGVKLLLYFILHLNCGLLVILKNRWIWGVVLWKYEIWWSTSVDSDFLIQKNTLCTMSIIFNTNIQQLQTPSCGGRF